jgi:hypothetical protein
VVAEGSVVTDEDGVFPAAGSVVVAPGSGFVAVGSVDSLDLLDLDVDRLFFGSSDFAVESDLTSSAGFAESDGLSIAVGVASPGIEVSNGLAVASIPVGASFEEPSVDVFSLADFSSVFDLDLDDRDLDEDRFDELFSFGLLSPVSNEPLVAASPGLVASNPVGDEDGDTGSGIGVDGGVGVGGSTCGVVVLVDDVEFENGGGTSGDVFAGEAAAGLVAPVGFAGGAAFLFTGVAA